MHGISRTRSTAFKLYLKQNGIGPGQPISEARIAHKFYEFNGKSYVRELYLIPVCHQEKMLVVVHKYNVSNGCRAFEWVVADEYPECQSLFLCAGHQSNPRRFGHSDLDPRVQSVG